MTSVAFNSGLWTAWRPDGRLQEGTGSELCPPPQSVQASEHTSIRTQQGDHVFGSLHHLGRCRITGGGWWSLSDLYCEMATPQTQLSLSLSRTAVASEAWLPE